MHPLLFAVADAIYSARLAGAHASPYHFVRVPQAAKRLGLWRSLWPLVAGR